MSEGKVSMALRLLTEDSKSRVLSLDSLVPSSFDPSGEPILFTARDILLDKHPIAKPADPSVLLDSFDGAPCYDLVLFEFDQ